MMLVKRSPLGRKRFGLFPVLSSGGEEWGRSLA